MKQNITDQQLLKVYMVGFNDCGNNIKDEDMYDDDDWLSIAYRLGWDDYIIGDEVKSIDLQTDEEILQRIKK